MESARIADQQARQAVAVWSDDDIFAVQKEEDMAAEVAYIDRLLSEVDRELADQATAVRTSARLICCRRWTTAPRSTRTRRPRARVSITRWRSTAPLLEARRVCVDCSRICTYYVPTSTRQCLECFEATYGVEIDAALGVAA